MQLDRNLGKPSLRRKNNHDIFKIYENNKVVNKSPKGLFYTVKAERFRKKWK